MVAGLDTSRTQADVRCLARHRGYYLTRYKSMSYPRIPLHPQISPTTRLPSASACCPTALHLPALPSVQIVKSDLDYRKGLPRAATDQTSTMQQSLTPTCRAKSFTPHSARLLALSRESTNRRHQIPPLYVPLWLSHDKRSRFKRIQ